MPVISDGRLILFHRLDDEEAVSCLDAASGEPLWEYRYPTAFRCLYEYSHGTYATPTIEGNRVWTVGAEGKLHCLALDTGELIWQRDLRAEYAIKKTLFGVGPAACLEGDLFIYNVGGSEPDSGIVAFDKESGEEVWRATNHRFGYCMPKAATIHAQRYVFVLTQEGLVALGPQDGTVFWEFPFAPKAPDSFNATSPLVIGDRVFLAMGPGPGCKCLRIKPDRTFEELWGDRRGIDSQFNNLSHHEGFVYGYTSKWNRGATFCCQELATGKRQWQFPSDLSRGSSIRTPTHFILWGEQGHLASMKINPQEPELECMTPEPLLDAPCYTAPALADGRLYLRNERELLCLDLGHKASGGK
ncbi:MAG: PQQ-like beta-propeller repeat protein [Planctomycetales bacterium]|nr:PQQ-like beta-propeller repeat protein [Planctomycetales bacterium]